MSLRLEIGTDEDDAGVDRSGTQRQVNLVT